MTTETSGNYKSNHDKKLQDGNGATLLNQCLKGSSFKVHVNAKPLRLIHGWAALNLMTILSILEAYRESNLWEGRIPNIRDLLVFV
jgi:hypothetical protein